MSGGQFNHGVTCGDCGAPMVLRHNSMTGSHFYGCSRFPNCRGVHGCHPDGSPLGIPANKQTRLARMAAHAAFDAAWQARGLTQKEGYRWLQEMTGLPKYKAHIAKFDEAQCLDLIERINLAEAVRVVAEDPAEVSA